MAANQNQNRLGQRILGTIFGSQKKRRAIEEMETCFYSPDFTAKLLAADGKSTLIVPASIVMGPLGWKVQFDFTGTGGSGGGTFGGVNYQTANYTALPADNGKIISMNNAGALTLTLPATSPSATWVIAVQCIGAGGVTISRNGRKIDKVTADKLLGKDQGIFIFSDGTDYYSCASAGAGAAGVLKKVANYSATLADLGKLISFNSSGALTLTLPATPPSTNWVIGVEFNGAGSLAIVAGGGSSAKLDYDSFGNYNAKLGNAQGMFIYTDGTDYFTCARPAFNVFAPCLYNDPASSGALTGGATVNGQLISGFTDKDGTFHAPEVYQLVTCEDDGTNTGSNKEYCRLIVCSERFAKPGGW